MKQPSYFSLSFCLFIILSFSFSFSSSGQKLSFDIFLFGSKIGKTVVERTVLNDSVTRYTLSSHSEAQIFFTHRVISLQYDIYYRNNQLFSSYSKSTRNDDVHITTIEKQGNVYLLKRDDGAFNTPLTNCSTIKLFFGEPCSEKYVFSERLGELRPVKKVEAGNYQAEMKDGLTYYYHYKAGKLVELEMRKGLLGSVYLRPSP